MKNANKFMSLRTLVVDGGELCCSQLMEVLHLNGYVSVFVAHNVSDGVRMAKRHRPDVIFLDSAMLEISELAVIVEIKKTLPAVAILMMSRIYANDRRTNNLLTNSVKYGAHGFIFKPFNDHSIIGVMAKISARFSMARAA